MTIDKLKRVMQRLRARYPGKTSVSYDELRVVVMYECGTTRQTYYNTRDALTKLGWIRRRKRRFILTGNDITEDF